MARNPFGSWQPKTDEQIARDNDFENNEALRDAALLDVQQWVGQIEQPESYEINGKALEVAPSVVQGMLNSGTE